MEDALERVLARIGGIGTVERLAGLSGSDFTSVMLEVARRRAARETPASVLRRYERDRFVRPGHSSVRAVRRAEDALLGCLPDDVEVVLLAPLVPLGAHSALGPVSQHKVVTTIRACEVAADPTNALALEAAARRVRSKETMVRLAAAQRVVRAQRFPAGFYPHFEVFGLVTAGRDTGSLRFERSALAEHLRFAIRGLTAAGAPRVQIELTPLSDRGEQIMTAVTEDLAHDPGDGRVEMVADRDREAGRGYYRDLCFKVNAYNDGERTEIGDGGFTDWTARLTANQKERLLISGLGTERLAALRAPAGTGRGSPDRDLMSLPLIFLLDQLADLHEGVGASGGRQRGKRLGR